MEVVKYPDPSLRRGGRPIETFDQELRDTARVIQHELDHIQGILFIDRLSSVEKLRVRGKLQEMERRFHGKTGS